ncbi:MAG: hypothetical protein ACE5JX_16960 [Acidobacteriota bacterium]
MIFAIGVPALVLYTLFYRGGEVQAPSIEGFSSYESEIMELRSDHYRVLGVEDEGGWLRVNVVLTSLPTDRLEARMQATNALYDVQSLVGRELSASIWAYSSDKIEKSNLKGMAFYHALTEQYNFKTADELP